AHAEDLLCCPQPPTDKSRNECDEPHGSRTGIIPAAPNGERPSVHTRPHLRWPWVRFGAIHNSLLFFKTGVCPMAEIQMPPHVQAAYKDAVDNTIFHNRQQWVA